MTQRDLTPGEFLALLDNNKDEEMEDLQEISLQGVMRSLPGVLKTWMRKKVVSINIKLYSNE